MLLIILGVNFRDKINKMYMQGWKQSVCFKFTALCIEHKRVLQPKYHEYLQYLQDTEYTVVLSSENKIMSV